MASTLRHYRRPILIGFAALAGLPLGLCLCLFGMVFWAERHAEQIIATHGQDLLGRPISAMVSLYGEPHRIRRERPRIIETATGRVVRFLDPYEAWYYCPWPRFLPASMCLQVFVEDGKITRLKDPLY
jgi:hypothetical protein